MRPRLEAAAARGWIQREAAILETLTSIRRAGADVVLTYWAAEAARLKRVVRRATEADEERVRENRAEAKRAMSAFREAVERHAIPIKPISAELVFDGSRLVFAYGAEEKVETRRVHDDMGGVRGCTHVTELLGSLPTAAVQTFAGLQREDEGDHKPFQLDHCHALESTTDTVRRYYPRWYRGGEVGRDVPGAANPPDAADARKSRI